MIDFLLQAALSNLVVASGIGLVAWLVQSRMRSPSLANLLWALVLIKLVTPPMVQVPLLSVPSLSTTATMESDSLSGEITDDLGWATTSSIEPLPDSTAATTPAAKSWPAQWPRRLLVLVCLVSGLAWIVSLIRLVRFHLMFRAQARFQNQLRPMAIDKVAVDDFQNQRLRFGVES